MVFGSLFSGAGLLDCGLQQAGIEHAWFCERDEQRRELLKRRWPGVPVHADVRKIGTGELARVDGIVGGFPCKGVSSAGPRNGFDHPETVLWHEMARIVGELRPRYVVLENVAALLSLKKGLVWQEVLEGLATLGFDVVWDCIPAAAVGAPHRRDRVFAVARHADGSGRQELDRATVPIRAKLAGAPLAGALATADAARNGEGGPGAARGTNRERTRTGADVASDAGRERGELRGGPAGVAGAGGEVEGEARERQRAWDAAGDSREVATDADDRRSEERTEQDQRSPIGQPAPFGDDSERRGVRVEWGDYEPAIRRWEAIHGAAPAPLRRVRRLDDGGAVLQRVRARMDRQRLSALGDGVHVYVGRVVGEFVMELERQAKERTHA